MRQKTTFVFGRQTAEPDGLQEVIVYLKHISLFYRKGSRKVTGNSSVLQMPFDGLNAEQFDAVAFGQFEA
jgi:hypothetical protein